MIKFSQTVFMSQELMKISLKHIMDMS